MYISTHTYIRIYTYIPSIEFPSLPMLNTTWSWYSFSVDVSKWSIQHFVYNIHSNSWSRVWVKMVSNGLRNNSGIERRYDALRVLRCLYSLVGDGAPSGSRSSTKAIVSIIMISQQSYINGARCSKCDQLIVGLIMVIHSMLYVSQKCRIYTIIVIYVI